MRKLYEKPEVEYLALISQEAIMGTDPTSPESGFEQGSMGLQDNPFS